MEFSHSEQFPFTDLSISKLTFSRTVRDRILYNLVFFCPALTAPAYFWRTDCGPGGSHIVNSALADASVRGVHIDLRRDQPRFEGGRETQRLRRNL